jgi:hypothetical protein
VLGDGILELLGGGLLGGLGSVWVGEREDMLGEWQQRPFCVLQV